VRQVHDPADARGSRGGHRGAIYIGDRDVTHTPPRDRDIAMVSHNYALYPHMTVAVEGVPSTVIIRVTGRGRLHQGETLYVTTDPQHVHVFNTDTGERLSE
jgi:hypothetical protein